MKKLSLSLFTFFQALIIFSQTITGYNRQEVMIPMRDGIKLYTVIFTPKEKTDPIPILVQRTPYGASVPDQFDLLSIPYFSSMAKEGYVIVFQDIRGKYKSEGTMQIHQSIIHLKKKGAIDESTDTYDAIDWLVRNVPNNNGRAGILG